jgi:hypothetical protein
MFFLFIAMQNYYKLPSGYSITNITEYECHHMGHPPSLGIFDDDLNSVQ